MSAGEQTATDSLVDSVHPTLPRWATRSKERSSLPQTVGRYRVGRRLGQGGVGTVHLAHDDELDREVAIKFVPCNTRDDVGARVLREARALARLSHPNIVHVYDYGRHEDYVHIVMELVEGRTLTDWLEEPSPWSRRLEMFVPIGEGLAAAHAAGVVHRDFKPSNVIVGADGRPRILDLGLARFVAEPDVAMSASVREKSSKHLDDATTREGAVMGTPKFMSPEQWAGRTVDARTDQFSFCLCLFMAVYGQPPFPMEAVMLGASGETPSIDVPTGTRVPVALRRALVRGLAIDPDDRWPSMDDLVSELRPLLRRRRWVTAGLVGLIAVAAGTGYGMRVDPTAACEQADADAPQWSARRDGIADRFEQTEQAYAADSFAFVDGRMQAFVEAWGEQAQSRCLAAARGELTTEAAERQQACLLAQTQRFDRTVEVLEELDAESVQRSAEIARSLPRPAACEDPGLAIDPQARAAIDRADLLRRAARYDDALGALPLDEPLLAEALQVRGRIAEDRGEPTEAVKDLQAAFVRAESEQRDALAAEVATDLVRVYGYRLGKAQTAEALVLTARAKVDRVAPAHDPMRADLAAVLGRFALGRGEPAEAAEHLAEAVALREAQDDALGLAADLNLRAQAQAMLGDHDAAMEGLLRALKIRTEALGPTHPLVGSNQLNLGHVSSMKGDADVAIGHFRGAKDVLEQALGPEHPQTAAAAMALARELADADHFPEAEAELRRAIAVYDARTMTTEAAKARNALAVELIEHERYDDAQEEIGIGIAAVREALGPTNAHMADLEFNAALALTESGRHEEALSRVERAAEISKAVYGPDSAEQRDDYAFESTILNRLRRYSETVALLKPWLDGTTEPSTDGDAARAVGEYVWAQLQLGRRDAAQSVLDRWGSVVETAKGPDALRELQDAVSERSDG